MFPEYNTQLQSAESCISQLFRSKTSTFRLETVSKSCNNTMPFHQPVSDHEMLFFPNPQMHRTSDKKAKRSVASRRWFPGCCLVFNRSSLYKKVGHNCWSCRTYRQEPNKKRQNTKKLLEGFFRYHWTWRRGTDRKLTISKAKKSHKVQQTWGRKTS